MRIARWLQLALVLQALLCAAVLTWAARRGAFALVLTLVCLPLWLRLPLTVQFVLAARAACRGASRPTAGDWLRAWWHEGQWAARVFGWWQPWREQALPDCLQPSHPGRGMVLVHGFGCNRAFWTPWLRRLRREGRACVAVNLQPPLADIDRYAAAIDLAVREVSAASGCAPLVVAHSMGGLAVRAWLHANPGADARIYRVVTLGTPHHGTPAARWGLGANARQMRPASAWLQTLAASETAPRRALFICWQSDCDNVVYPLGTALLGGGEAHTVRGVGHVQLAFEPRVVQACFGLLRP
ncbi:triacylglycerol lipase [Comamonas sp. NLF-1-9]|uniref:esterase/lipase family protein n=1 Tax=Comamonas sp. NLF-1-9 TaxID=2853163 RepID=UPI001C44651D|nr:alpha/beta fold hydrolase [Comamonas sp. NLF-1-9]QXL83584.1 alpha/beta fold hydrolase [Comamonas sp. NLF-1-9]